MLTSYGCDFVADEKVMLVANLRFQKERRLPAPYVFAQN
jgi:hypothetical protein